MFFETKVNMDVCHHEKAFVCVFLPTLETEDRLAWLVYRTLVSVLFWETAGQTTERKDKNRNARSGGFCQPIDREECDA